MKKIAFIGQPEYFRFIYENDLDDVFVVREFKYTFDDNEYLQVDLLNFNADYNIFFRGEFVDNVLLDSLNGVKIALSSEPFPKYINNKLCYTYDSYCRFDSFINNINDKNYDYVFHYDHSSLSFFEKINFNISGIFNFPVATGTYQPLDVKQKKWDVFFIGRSSAYREKLLGPLKHYFNVLHIAHGVYGADIVRYMNSSKILLNLHAENEISWEDRIQMSMATKGFVMSHPISKNDFLIPSIDFIEVNMNDKDDLFQKTKYYLERDDERKQISHNGYNKIMKYFEAKKNIINFLSKIDSHSYKKFVPNQKFFSYKKMKYLGIVQGISNRIINR